MTETKIRIELDKEFYESGSEVAGIIDMKTRDALCISRINLTFTKKLNLKLRKIEEMGVVDESSEIIKLNQDLFDYKFEVYHNSDPLEEISSGHHKFPFKFTLKREDNGSTEIKGLYFDFLCDVRSRYNLAAEVFMFGAHNAMYVVDKEVHVIDPLTEPTQFSTRVQISSPICFFSRKYDILFDLDRALYLAGECLELRATVSSKKPIIKQIECFLYEVLSVTVGGKSIVRSKYIVGGDATPEEDGRTFRTSLRIPSTTPSTVTDPRFSLKAVLFVNINFFKGSPVRAKKYVRIAKRSISYPEIDTLSVLEGEVYPEKVFVLS
jgi:hypothetical protein